MMMTIPRLIVTLSFAAIWIESISGQTCGGEITKTVGCLLGKVKEIKERLPADMTEEQEKEIEKKTKACFVDAGCKPIEGSNSIEMTDNLPPEIQQLVDFAEQLGVPGLDVSNLQENMKAAEKCGNKVKDSLKPKLESCVKDSNPMLADFVLPEVNLGDEENDMPNPMELPAMSSILQKHKQKFHELMMHGKMIAAAMYNDDICEDGLEQQIKVRECIEAIVEEATPEEFKCKSPLHAVFLVSEIKKEVCTTKDQCMEDNMSEECRELHDNELPTTVCGCLRDVIDDEWDTLKENTLKCISEEIGGEVPSYPGIFTRKRGPIYAFTMRLVDKMCQLATDPAMDPCKQDPSAGLMMPFMGGPGQGQPGGGPPMLPMKGPPPMMGSHGFPPFGASRALRI